MSSFHRVDHTDHITTSDAKQSSTLLIVGRPNSGKTSVFNRLTGSQLKTGNYHGVTVEHAEGPLTLSDHTQVNLIDLPGTPSLIPSSPDEGLTADALVNEALGSYDATLVIVDALRLIEGLYIGLQVIELAGPVIIAINQIDLAHAAGLTIDLEQMQRDLRGDATHANIEVVGISAHTGEGFDTLKLAIARQLSMREDFNTESADSSVTDQPSVTRARGDMKSELPWGPQDISSWLEVHPELGELARSAAGALPLSAYLRWAVLTAHEGESPLDPKLRLLLMGALREPDGQHALAQAEQTIISRFRWLDQRAASWSRRHPTDDQRATQRDEFDTRARTELIDSWLLHPLWGSLTFAALMLLLFQALFVGADPFVTLIEDAVQSLGSLASAHLPEGILSEFIIEGLINGVGNVIVFLPQVLILFGLIGLMEDSGYMARAAALMDRVMRAAGLSGRAFVPMLSGFICAVPAILATRTLPQRRDRLLTMMALPLLTCSARLPVYTLLITTLLPAEPWLFGIDQRAWVMVALYLFSALSAFAAVWVMGRTILRGETPPLLLHLPIYRRPVWRDVLRNLSARAWVFIKEAGTVILAGTIVLWFLLSFPRIDTLSASQSAELPKAAHSNIETTQVNQSSSMPLAKPQVDSSQVIAQADQSLESPHSVDAANTQLAAQRAKSYGAQIGRFMEPALKPLGWDWQVGVGLIGAFAAREVFISTLGMVYGVGGEVDEESDSLRERIKSAKHTDGTPIFTPTSALALLVFFSLACQCLSTLAAVKRETGGYRWPLFMLGYMTALAYGCALLVTWIGALL